MDEADEGVPSEPMDPLDATAVALTAGESLASVQASGEPIEDTLASSPSPLGDPSTVQRGAVIGRYIVADMLGAGAMGVVLAAYDPELDRKVALKLLKYHAGDSSSARARLAREAQALAKLDHRNVVGVYDVGSHAGQLFVAMEFIKGQDLGVWLAEAETPREWREVLRVFVEAGRGLAAAHGAGLVHRDVKPANLMRGEDGRVRVMDFGLARARAEESAEPRVGIEQSFEEVRQTTGNDPLTNSVTREGAVVGTPAYMAPEQLSGLAATAASDQFGFCVALYEALYGGRPFAGASMVELVEVIGRADFEPVARGSTVPSWLREVLRRGLASDPAERWPSMQALLDALNNDPVARRRKAVAGLAVVGLLGGSAWGLSAAVEAEAEICSGFESRLEGVWDRQRKTEVRTALEATGLGYASQTAALVEQGLDAYTQEWVEARVHACEATHNGEQSGQLLDLRMACLDQRLAHVRALVEVFAQADGGVVAKASEAVGELPRLEACEDLEALRAEHPLPEDPAVAERVVKLDAQLIEVAASRVAGHFDAGAALAAAVVEEAKAIGYEPLLARAWLEQGFLQEDRGDYENAEATLIQAYDASVAQQMADEATKASVMLMYLVAEGLNRYEDSWVWAAQADPWSRAAGTDAARGSFFNNRAVLALHAGDYERAREDAERSLAIHEKILGPGHPTLAKSLTNLGTAAYSQGDYAQAREDYTRALEVFEQALGPKHPHTGSACVNLGNVALAERHYDQAHAHLERALAISEQAVGANHPSVGTILTNLGALAYTQKQHQLARGYFERAHQVYEAALGPEHLAVAIVETNLGSVAVRERQFERARDHAQRALVIYEQLMGPEHPDIVNPLVGLGQAQLGLGLPGEALVSLERAFVLRTAHPRDPLDFAELQFSLAQALWDTPADAGRDRVRARALAELARGTYTDAGADTASEREAVEAWQLGHGQGCEAEGSCEPEADTQ